MNKMSNTKKGIMFLAIFFSILSMACATQTINPNTDIDPTREPSNYEVSDSAQITYCVVGSDPAYYGVYVFTKDTYSHYDYTMYWLEAENGYDYFNEPTPTDRDYLVFKGDMPQNAWESIKTTLENKRFDSLPENLSEEDIFDGAVLEIEVLDGDKRAFSGGYCAGDGLGSDHRRFKIVHDTIYEAISLCEEDQSNNVLTQMVSFYVSSDGSVYLRHNSDSMETYIVDGNRWIKVDIAIGGYEPKIEKFDVDGDGEDEYLIAECEGTGTGCSLYGLVIVDDDGKKVTRFSSSDLVTKIDESISYSYDKFRNEVTVFEVLPPFSNRYEGATVKIRQNDNLESIVYSDIVDVSFKDGKVYMTAHVGYVYSGTSCPDYENSISITAQFHINEDCEIEYVFWIINPEEEQEK
ncbi:MAG: hypothetical protein K5654_08765 [Lachnospiraceae bacterium]|nr:hypothetical protein [Lachnospiraceae bacterium]